MAISPIMDESKQKRERRRTTYKLVRRRRPTNILATNFPGPSGKKFVHKLAGLGIPITLVEKKGFTRSTKADLKNVVTLAPPTDIFYEMLSGKYDFIDADLCNGPSIDAIESLTSCSKWKTLIVTVTDRFRGKFGTKSAVPKGVHIQQFMFDLCKKHNWDCQLSFSPAPYKRPNKNELKGLLDGRGPWYYTFIITRD